MTCPRRDKWFRACKFEPRFDLSPVQFPEDANLETLRISTAALETFRHKTYYGDVCIRCGHAVNKLWEDGQ